MSSVIARVSNHEINRFLMPLLTGDFSIVHLSPSKCFPSTFPSRIQMDALQTADRRQNGCPVFDSSCHWIGIGIGIAIGIGFRVQQCRLRCRLRFRQIIFGAIFEAEVPDFLSRRASADVQSSPACILNLLIKGKSWRLDGGISTLDMESP